MSIVYNSKVTTWGDGVEGGVQSYIPHISTVGTIARGDGTRFRKTVDAIISVLAYGRSMTAKQIYFAIKRMMSRSVSYRATHKMLQNLASREIVEKSGREYALSIEWARRVKRLAENFEMRTLDLLFVCDLNDGSALVNVGTLDQLDSIITYTYRNHSTARVYAKSLFLRWAMLYPHRLLDGNSFQAVNENIYTVSCWDTPIDRWCKGVEEELGMKTATGVGSGRRGDVLAIGEYVVTYEYPKEIIDPLRRIYESVVEVTPEARKRIWKSIRDVFQRKTCLTVSVVKNRMLAETIREEVRRYF